MTSGTLVVVVGPTAIGKTNWAITLAEALGTEILSADSRQFYREMAIGTAVPDPDQLACVPHHFIQHISIKDHFSVGDYERAALARLEVLFKNNATAVMVGGSGLYIDAVVKGLDRFPEIGDGIREELNQVLENQGINRLREELREADPEYYERVDLDNPHRLIRALEVYRSSGKPYSSFLGNKTGKRNFSSVFVGFTADRPVIYQRINQRVDQMVVDGLLEEARRLYPYRHLPALQTVGYREFFRYFEGEKSMEEAVDEIKKNTRRYAKRQLTWFRNRPEIKWFPYNTGRDDVLAYIRNAIKKSSGDEA